MGWAQCLPLSGCSKNKKNREIWERSFPGTEGNGKVVKKKRRRNGRRRGRCTSSRSWGPRRGRQRTGGRTSAVHTSGSDSSRGRVEGGLFSGHQLTYPSLHPIFAKNHFTIILKIFRKSVQNTLTSGNCPRLRLNSVKCSTKNNES